jgi:hypothetical protein
VIVDGRVLFEFVEPDGVTGSRKLSHGTFGLQAHDPDSVVHFRNLRVKRLPCTPPLRGGPSNRAKIVRHRLGG